MHGSSNIIIRINVTNKKSFIADISSSAGGAILCKVTKTFAKESRRNFFSSLQDL